jgi:hypothetical protein
MMTMMMMMMMMMMMTMTMTMMTMMTMTMMMMMMMMMMMLISRQQGGRLDGWQRRRDRPHRWSGTTRPSCGWPVWPQRCPGRASGTALRAVTAPPSPHR